MFCAGLRPINALLRCSWVQKGVGLSCHTGSMHLAVLGLSERSTSPTSKYLSHLLRGQALKAPTLSSSPTPQGKLFQQIRERRLGVSSISPLSGFSSSSLSSILSTSVSLTTHPGTEATLKFWGEKKSRASNNTFVAL